MRFASSTSSILLALVFAACGGENGGTDAGSDAGPDAGMSTFDAGMIGACNAGTVQLEPTCPVFVPCGGTPSGSWCYTNVCIETGDLFGPALSACPGLTLEVTTGSVLGRIEFTGGTQVHREVNTHLEGFVQVPALCVMFGGFSCADIEGLAEDQLGADGTATCQNSGGGCDCVVTFDTNVDSTAAYTVTGNTLTTAGRTFDFCADGTNFTFQETGSMAEPGIQTTAPE